MKPEKEAFIDPTKLNAIELARFWKVTLPSIYKWTHRGYIFRSKEKIYDLNHSVNIEFVNQRDTHAALKNGKQFKYQITEEVDAFLKKEKLKEELITESRMPSNVDDLVGMSMAELERIKMAEAIRATRLRNEIARGDLVSRKLVKQVFAKIYTIDANELRTMSQSLAPEIAGACEINSAEKVVMIAKIIDDNIFQTLNHIKRLIDDALHGMQVEQSADGAESVDLEFVSEEDAA